MWGRDSWVENHWSRLCQLLIILPLDSRKDLNLAHHCYPLVFHTEGKEESPGMRGCRKFKGQQVFPLLLIFCGTACSFVTKLVTQWAYMMSHWHIDQKCQIWAVEVCLGGVEPVAALLSFNRWNISCKVFWFCLRLKHWTFCLNWAHLGSRQ